MQQSGDHRIHVEFADFSSIEFFSLFEKYVVRNANSLGMNEQEMKLLLKYWENPDKNKILAEDSKPTFDEIL